MKTTSAIALGILMAVTLNGCPSPTVKYVTNPKEDFDGEIKFRLLSSNILIAKAQEDKTGAIKVDAANDTTQSFADVSATVVPKEDESHLFALLPKSSWLWLVNTNLSATFQDNTRLIKQIGVSVDDNRLKAIQAVGTIATAIVALGAPPSPPTIKVPVVISPYDSKDDWEQLPSNSHWEYKVVFNSPRDKSEDLDAIDANTFFTKHDDDKWFNSTSVVPISSCRHIILKVRPTLEYSTELENPKDPGENGNVYRERIKRLAKEHLEVMIRALKDKHNKAKDESDDTYNKRLAMMALSTYEPEGTRTFPLQIADHRFVRTVRLPDKGSVSPHTICGADTKTESSTITGYQDLLAELGKQAKAVYDAQKAKEKDKAK